MPRRRRASDGEKCQYDYGDRTTLYCLVHPGHRVLVGVTPWGGETLKAMLGLGLLTGRAKEEAERGDGAGG